MPRTTPVTDEELMDCYQHSGPKTMTAQADERERSCPYCETVYLVIPTHTHRCSMRDLKDRIVELVEDQKRPTPPGQDLVTRAQDWLLNAASKQWAWDKSVASLAAEFAEVEKAAVERAAEMAGRYDEDIAKAIRSAGK